MELLLETAPTVIFYHPTADTAFATVTWKKNGVVQNTVLSPITPAVSGQTRVRLPYQPEEAVIELTWNFTIPGSGTHTKVETYRVITPLLTLREVREIVGFSGTTMSEEELKNLEATVRYTVQAHTGQTFGKYTGTKTVYATKRGVLPLPERLMRLDKIEGILNPIGYKIDEDGYVLKDWAYGVPPIRQDAFGTHHTGYPEHSVIYDSGAPIMAPGVGNSDKFPIQVTGVWGWEHVPGPVKDAARLLVNDYACDDSLYRDRYIEAMTAADWRIQFNERAYLETGNVRADQLLSDYVTKRGWAVL